MLQETELKERSFNTDFKESKVAWLKERLLLNLGFVPKLFGYTDENLYYLTGGKLKEWIAGVEYYFGITLKGTESRLEDFPQFLIKERLIKVLHAPFAETLYHSQSNVIKNFYKWIRSNVLARADPNPWHRLAKALWLTAQCKVPKLNIHVIDIISAPHKDQLFYELNKMACRKGIIICLENTPCTHRDQIYNKKSCKLAHDPHSLIEYISENKLNNMRVTIDTAHVAASHYSMAQMWEKIVQYIKNDINKYIGHFHLVDYDENRDFDAAVPGDGVIGLPVFKKMIDDLYIHGFEGTISLEVAPLYFHNAKYKVFFNAMKRFISPLKPDVREEEEYILGIIKKIVN